MPHAHDILPKNTPHIIFLFTNTCIKILYSSTTQDNLALAEYPLRGNHQCLIFMKYRIIFLIIINISLGQILLLSYTLQTHHARTHERMHAPARTHAHTHTHTSTSFRLWLFDGSVAPNRDGPLRWRQWLVAGH